MKTILVTGANGNLGAAVIQKLHEKGYGVCATIGPGPIPQEFETWTLEMRSVDLMNEKESGNYAGSLAEKYADLKAAVLLVGGFTMGSLREADAASIDKQITLNFKTAYFLVRPLMDVFAQRGGGQFILIGARPALHAEAGKDMVAYAISKGMIFHLAELINAHGKKKGITATVIVPSTIDTEANRKSMPDADFSKWVRAEDIAETIAFILSGSGASIRDTVVKVYGES